MIKTKAKKKYSKILAKKNVLKLINLSFKCKRICIINPKYQRKNMSVLLDSSFGWFFKFEKRQSKNSIQSLNEGCSLIIKNKSLYYTFRLSPNNIKTQNRRKHKSYTLIRKHQTEKQFLKNNYLYPKAKKRKKHVWEFSSVYLHGFFVLYLSYLCNTKFQNRRRKKNT